MENNKLNYGHWSNISNCIKEISKYEYLYDFRINSNSAYQQIIKKGWCDLLDSLKCMRVKNNYYTYEICKKEALLYEYLRDFRKHSPNIYQKSYRSGWLHNICMHMKKMGNKYNKLVYVYEFADNHFYVGLTYNIENRNKQHLSKYKNNNSSVNEYIMSSGLEPILIEKTGYINYKEAIILEEFYLLEYINNGWVTLNKVKTGSIGGANIKWDKESCAKESLKYKNKTEFKKNSGGAYKKCYESNWLDELCIHMYIIKYPNGFWNDYYKCKKVSIKYKSRDKLRIDNWSVYNYSKINGWLDEFIPLIPVKLVEQYSLEGDLLNVFDSVNEASITTDSSYQCIYKCCKGEIKSSNGFIWKYKEH